MEIQCKNKRVREQDSPTQSQFKNKKEKPSATTEESQTNECKTKHNHLFVTPAPVRQSRSQSNSSYNNSRSSSTEKSYSNAAPRGSKFRNAKPKFTKCNLTEDIGITIYVPETDSFDREKLNDEIATKISKDIANRRIDYDFKMRIL